MTKYPYAFAFIVAAIRLTAIYILLSLVYATATAVWGMGSQLIVPLFEMMLRNCLVPVLAAVVLWFIARPIGKFVLRDFDNA
jgi:hypothetical protein